MGIEYRELVAVGAAARECERTPATVRRWAREGNLPAETLGNRLFVRRDDLRRMASRPKRREKVSRLAALEEAQTVRERIYRRLGGNLDVSEALDGSREAHP